MANIVVMKIQMLTYNMANIVLIKYKPNIVLIYKTLTYNMGNIVLIKYKLSHITWRTSFL